MSDSNEQMSSNPQRSLACNDSSSLQQTERFTAGTTWKLARISRRAGLVVRYLGLSATPPEFAEQLLAELQKTLSTRVPVPGPLLPRFAISAGGQTNNLFVVPDFLFLSRVTASRLHVLALTGPDWTRSWGRRPIFNASAAHGM